MPKPVSLSEQLRHLYQLNGWAEVVPASKYNLGEGGYVIEVAARIKGNAFEYEPLRYPVSNAVAFWTERQTALNYLADMICDL